MRSHVDVGMGLRCKRDGLRDGMNGSGIAWCEELGQGEIGGRGEGMHQVVVEEEPATSRWAPCVNTRGRCLNERCPRSGDRGTLSVPGLPRSVTAGPRGSAGSEMKMLMKSMYRFSDPMIA